MKEKDFRQWGKEHDWSQYEGKAVAVFCSADAIIPHWAFMLISSQLSGIAAHVQFGTESEAEFQLISAITTLLECGSWIL